MILTNAELIAVLETNKSLLVMQVTSLKLKQSNLDALAAIDVYISRIKDLLQSDGS